MRVPDVPLPDEIGNVLLVVVGGGLVGLLVRLLLGLRSGHRPSLIALAARLCLILTLGLWGAAAAVAVVAAAMWAPVVVLGAVIVGVLLARRSFRGSGWTHGSARWADASDLTAAGYLDGRPGFPLGLVSGLGLRAAARNLLRAPWHASEGACRVFLATLRRGRVWATLPRAVHMVVFCPTGGGKSTAFVIPWLLTNPDSAVVIDPKGEIAWATAERRRRMGHRVVLLDPFRAATDSPDTFNPLAGIDPADPRALDECVAIAGDVVVRTGREHDDHWNDVAELNISGITGLVLRRATPDRRNLQTVADLLASRDELAAAKKVMEEESEAWDGMLARVGSQLGHFVDRELGSTLTTVARHLRFLSTPAVAANTRASSFDPRGLRAGRMTVYLVLPTEYLRSHAGLLRLWVGGLLRSAVRGGPSEGRPVHYLLDEAGALGNMRSVEDAVTQLRGYGVRFQFFYQGMGQLERCFPDGQAQTILANATQVFLGVNDLPTAEYVSNRLGTATVPVWTATGGASATWSSDPQGLPSRSGGDNTGYSASDTGRKLLFPEEVMRVGGRRAIVFAPGVPPVQAVPVRYYEAAFRAAPGRRPWVARLWMAARALLLLAVTAALAAAGGFAVEDEFRAAADPQPAKPVPLPYYGPPQPQITWPPPAWPAYPPER